MCINNKGGSIGAAEDAPNDFTGEHIQSCFMRNDDIISVATGNSLLFYSYSIDNQGKNDIKKLQAKREYKLLQEYKATSKTICAMCHQNTLVSPYVLYIGSDRSVNLYNTDENVCVDQCVAHSKDIHTLKMFRPSSLHPSEVSHNLFYTCSLDNTLKVWDMRTFSPFAEFSSHLNHAVKVGCDVSKCLRYAFCGSEDRSVYIYDMRMRKLVL